MQGPKVLKIYPRRTQCAHPWRMSMAHVHGGNGVLTEELVGEEGERVPQRVRRRRFGFCSGTVTLRRLGLARARRRFRFERRRREGNSVGRKKEPPPLPYL